MDSLEMKFRTPVSLAIHNGQERVVCDDGSYWRLDGDKWREEAAIDGTVRAKVLADRKAKAEREARGEE